MRAAILAAIAASLAGAGCAESRGVSIGLGPDAQSQLIAELLHAELAARPAGAERVPCVDELACVAKLRSRRIDVVAVERDALEWLVPAGDLAGAGLELVTELPLTRRFHLVVAADHVAREIGDLARTRIAVSDRFARRATSGFAELASAYRLSRSPAIIANPSERAAALERGEVEAAVFESWRTPPGARALPDPREALEGGTFVIVAASGRRPGEAGSIEHAAGAAGLRAGALGDRLLAAVASGMTPAAAARAIAPPGRSPSEPLVLAAPAGSRWLQEVETALATRGVHHLSTGDPAAALRSGRAQLALSPNPIDGEHELIAVFESPDAAPIGLWSRTGVLDLAEARRVLGVSPSARLPGGEGPSLWQRAAIEQAVPPRQRPSWWLDTLANVMVAWFFVWLVVRVFWRDDLRVRGLAATGEGGDQ
jgi:hypothetical protein